MRPHTFPADELVPNPCSAEMSPPDTALSVDGSSDYCGFRRAGNDTGTIPAPPIQIRDTVSPQFISSCSHHIMLKRMTLFLLFLFILFAPEASLARETPPIPDDGMEILLERMDKPLTGDLSAIRKRRVIRVLTAYSKTNFFNVDGTLRGFEYELLANFEKFLNRDEKDPLKQVKAAFIPLPFEKLLDALEQGKGDIVAAGLTVTSKRKEQVDFANSYIPNVSEVVVLSRDGPAITSIEELSGQTVYVRPGSSYATHLSLLNKRFAGLDRPPVRVIATNHGLTTEDILELLNAGIIKITVADRHVAEAWASVLPNIVVRKDLAVNKGGALAWAIRKNSPELGAALNAYVLEVKKGTLLGNILFARYYEGTRWISNPISENKRNKLSRLVNLFHKYAVKYGFDWPAIASQAYQESGLDNDRVSSHGAVGVMQVLPSTAAAPPINITDIHLLENNIHAGVKYLHHLLRSYFDDPAIQPSAKIDFAWAAYNAGPTRISKLRDIAEKRGFDKNRWFHHVEKIAAEVIGRETVQYVANINKYYIAYKMLNEEVRLGKERIRGFKAAPP